MKQKFTSNHFWTNGNPSGGCSFGTGFTISWQNGPLGRGDDRIKPNGAFVETIIAAALDRLNFYQSTKFKCEENAQAIKSLKDALSHLKSRTSRRELANVEGTHQGS